MRMRYQSYLMIMCSFNLRRCDELSGIEDSVRFTCKGVERFRVHVLNKSVNSILSLSDKE